MLCCTNLACSAVTSSADYSIRFFCVRAHLHIYVCLVNIDVILVKLFDMLSSFTYNVGILLLLVIVVRLCLRLYRFVNVCLEQYIVEETERYVQLLKFTRPFVYSDTSSVSHKMVAIVPAVAQAIKCVFCLIKVT